MGGQTNKNTGNQCSATCKLDLFFNDFIRMASIFYFVIHFPQAALDTAGLFPIPIRLGGKKIKKGQNNGNFTRYSVFFFNPVSHPDNFFNL